MRRRAGLAIAVVAISAVSGASLAATAADEDQVPVLVPAEPEQSANGPRVVQSWTGSAIYMRDGWSLEVLDPEPDLAAATAGEAWEAMRLTSPLGQRTCSLYVALAEDGQPSLDRTWAHTKPRPIIKPRWDFTGNRPALLYPDPAQRLAPAKAWYDDDWSAWTSTCHPHLEHEVLQVWACAQVVGTLEPMELAPFGFARVIAPTPKPDEVWGTTQPAGEMGQPRAGFTATLLPDGRVLVVGGRFEQSLVSAEIWDPATRAFQPAGEMRRRRMNHAAVLQPDGRVLVVGGSGRFGGDIKDAELWDPATSSFSRAGVLRTPRTGAATVTAFPDGRALVVGGGAIENRAGRALRAELWDPRTQAFEAAGRLDSARNGHRAFALFNGDAVVTGPGNKEWLRWDARKRAFEQIGRPSEPRPETHQLANGRLLAAGVNDEATCKRGKAYASTPDAEVWLPRQGLFQAAGAFRSPRYEATVTPLPDGSALFYGGGIATCMDASRYRSAELWDPASRTFQRAGRTELPHWDEVNALLHDGRVAIIGGLGTDDYACGEAVLGAIELWDPSTRSFSVAGALDHPRSAATAIPLDDGSVLVLGGFDQLGDPVAAAELWVPPRRAGHP